MHFGWVCDCKMPVKLPLPGLSLLWIVVDRCQYSNKPFIYILTEHCKTFFLGQSHINIVVFMPVVTQSSIALAHPWKQLLKLNKTSYLLAHFSCLVIETFHWCFVYNKNKNKNMRQKWIQICFSKKCIYQALWNIENTRKS